MNADTTSQHVTTEIKVWMARRRMNQTDVAQKMGHDQTWVSRRLSGKRAMTVDDLEDFAKALDVPAAEFFRVRDDAAGSTNYRSA